MKINMICILIVCACVVGIILACTLAIKTSSYTEKKETLEQAIERLARESDERMGW